MSGGFPVNRLLGRVASVMIFPLVLCCLPALGLAQQEKKESSPPEQAAWRKPTYLDLRYNEDFSYLDGPKGSYASDLFDPVKQMHLKDDWTLSLGGEFRFRLESETNKAFGSIRHGSDTFQLYRFFTHADFRYQDNFRLFIQGVSVFDENRNLAPRGIDENKWDLHQFFFDVKPWGKKVPLTVRVGRQELSYGSERIISAFDWGNVRRRFDGVKILTHSKSWDIDLWYAKPVLVQRKQRDRYNEDFDFWGVYATNKTMEHHGLDLYFFAVDDIGSTMNPNGHRGDRSIFTLGSRFWGKTAGWDYEAELAGQWGRWAGDTVQAWSLALDGGYTFKKHAGKPRIGVGFDWASGDEDPLDGKVGTFTQLFPLGHKYFGFMDLIGRQNINAFNVNLSAWPVSKKVKARAALHTFWLNEQKDSLYNAGGAAGRRDPLGRSGKKIGQELDLTVMVKVDHHAKLLFGYSHFWDSTFITQSGVSEDVDFYYIQYKFTF